MSNEEFYNYLKGRRDIKTITYEVVEHQVETETTEAVIQDGYIVKVDVDHIRGKRSFLLAETYHTGKRGEIHTRQTLSKMLQAGVR